MTREEAAMCKEIARELRQQLPEQVNLADLMGAEAFMGSMWGWDDPAPYAMDRAACWLEALADSSPTPDPSTGLLPCEYCTTGKPLFVDIDKHTVTISGSDLRTGIVGEFAELITIQYCPMCGRKLEVEG